MSFKLIFTCISAPSHVIIALEQSDSCNVSTIQDVIYTLHYFRKQYNIPFQLILLTVSPPDMIQRNLARSALVKLSTTLFPILSADNILDLLIEKLLVSCHRPISLSLDVYELLLDKFLLHDKSVTMFVQKIRYAILDFYYSNPCSYFTLSYLESVDDLTMQTDEELVISDSILQWVKMQSSFHTYI